MWQAVLFNHAKSGYLEMPEKGGAAELSDEAVEAAAGEAARRAVRVLLVEPDGRAAACTFEALAEAGVEVRHARVLEAAAALVAEWVPQAVLVAPGAAAEDPPTALHNLPTILLGGPAAGTWGPPVIRLPSDAGPETILASLHELEVMSS
jgi:hypothetical protein